MHLLLIRFSAMGDVALLSPVVYNALEQNPELKITVVSRPAFRDIFAQHPRFHFFGADLKGVHRGVRGLFRLYRALRKSQITAVLDIHDVLRSRILSTFFRMGGISVTRFNKGRAEKKAVLGNLPLAPLKHTAERYFEALAALNLKTGWLSSPLPPVGQISANINNLLDSKSTEEKWIGVAPYAQHPSKIWGDEKMVQALRFLEAKFSCKFFLFGGGSREIEQLKNLAKHVDSSHLVAGNHTLAEELALMQHLDVMISMDSANMHLASLVGTKVVSIWGPTHPFIGFAPLFNTHGVVQVDLPCRPCSIFGKIKTSSQAECAAASMNAISPEMVSEKVISILNNTAEYESDRFS